MQAGPTHEIRFTPGRKVRQGGTICRGWALMRYEMHPVALFAPGDFIDHDLTQYPTDITALTELSLSITDVAAAPPRKATFNMLARHAARCKMSALRRTLDMLLELADKLAPVRSHAITIDLPLSQAILADLLGMSPVHMNRTLMQLEQLGLVNHGKGYVIITDKPRAMELVAQ